MLNSAVKAKPVNIEAARQEAGSNDNLVGPVRPGSNVHEVPVMQQQLRHQAFVGGRREQEKMYGSDLWAPLARPTKFEFV